MRKTWKSIDINPYEDFQIEANVQKVDGLNNNSYGIFWGGDDRLIPVKQGERLSRALPDSQLIVLDGAGHPCYLDKPLDFHRELLQFLRGLDF